MPQTKMSMTTTQIIVTVAFSMLLLSCNMNPNKIDTNQLPKDDLSLEVAGPSPEELSTERMDAYVNLINHLAKQARQSKQYYLKWCNEQTGPTGKESNVYTLYDLDSYKSDLENAEKLIPQNPALTIDKHAKEFITASLPLISIVSEAHYYYDQENYKDDNFAKGKELHPKLMSAFNAFEQALGKFESEYDKIYNERAAKQNEELKKQGKTLALDIQSIVNQSEQLLNELMPIALDVRTKLTNEQSESLQAKINTFEKIVLDFDANLKATSEEKLKEQFRNPNNLSMFSDDAKDFLKDVKDIFRIRKTGKEYNSSYEREVNELVDQYDDLVQRMNFCGILI